MGGNVNDYQKAKAEYHDQPNTVLSVVKVDRYAIRFTDGQGKVSMCLVDCFGQSTDDGMLGVFIIANEREMTEKLRRPSKLMLEQIRSQIADRSPATIDEIPSLDPNIAAQLDDVVTETAT